MRFAFTKMHGLGNDFVVVDATRAPVAALFRAPPPSLLARLTDRRFGVGCDQVLVIEPPPARDVDFGYRIFNADGSEVGQCGNGVRCLARFVRDRGLSAQSKLRVRTSTTTMEMNLRDDGLVTVNMGVPRFEPRDIPLAMPARALRYRLSIDDAAVEFGAVSMGNPHAVIAVNDVDGAPVSTLAPVVQAQAAFPQGVNVGFLQIVDERHARLRVYERGAGETLACGSGACAAMAVGRIWGRLGTRVEMALRGGTLHLEWAGENQPLWMTGPAETVFEGSMEWPD
jgi:diaminopimelate epimerase